MTQERQLPPGMVGDHDKIIRLTDWREGHGRDHDDISRHLERIEARMFQLILAVLSLAGVGAGVAVTIAISQ